VQEGLAGGGAEAGEVKLVDVAFLELVHEEPHGETVRCDFGPRD
jgi:hypothetical protein